MSKKILVFVVMLVISFSLFACKEDININIADDQVTMTVGDTYQIDFTTNDTQGITFSSSDSTVLTIDENGIVSALKEGSAQVMLTSKIDSNVTFTMTVTVFKRVLITTDVSAYNLTVGNEQIVGYDANDDVTFTTSDATIFSVDSEGKIVALKEGQAQLTITSVYNSDITAIIDIFVTKFITIEVDHLTESLWVGSEVQVIFESNDDVSFTSSNTEVLTVSQTGLITGVSQGSATVTIQSQTNNEVDKVITVDVYLPTEMIMITGLSQVNLDTQNQLNIQAGPNLSYPFVLWESSNPEIASIDQNGLLTANSVGDVTISATSLFDDEITSTFDLEVVNYLLVNQASVQNDTLDFMNLTFTYEMNLFSNLQDAIDASTSGATIFVNAGTYAENIIVNQNDIKFVGAEDAIIQGEVDIQADDILFEQFEFSQSARIKNTIQINHFEFRLNTIENSTLSAFPFIRLSGVLGVNISSNTFTNLSTDAIWIQNFLGGNIIVEKNIISNVEDAITILAETEYADDTVIQIVRNEIDGANIAINLNLAYGENQKDIIAYARFNSIMNYSSYAVESNIGNQIDFTCNYWGAAQPDPLKFLNVSVAYYRGYYSDQADIVSEANYNPALPVTFEITNPIYEITIGDTYAFTFDAFPLDVVDPKVKWITSDPTVLLPSITGAITPLKSGIVTLTLRSSFDARIKTTITITVVTTPGIEMSTSNVDNNILVGDTVTLTATPFPFNIKDEVVFFQSSDNSIATIDESGVVTTLQQGNVTFTASLLDDPQVFTSYTLDVYDSLDENDLLDLLTMNQVAYSEQHTWTAFGVSFNFTNFKNESVSKYYFAPIETNQSKLLPVSSGIRPGEPMEPHPEGVTQYNPFNVYWVVIHDTANTNPGAGALSHANYLWNAAMAGTELWVSWHYTIDDTFLYQHLPEIERGYHAGDGSTLPLQGITYLGGGNRNGIGIEMSINQDGDMYRTWQRTAKLSADIMNRYNLPRQNTKYHNDFSGKDCPRSLRNAGLIPLFEEFLDIEYRIKHDFGDAQIIFDSNDPEYLDQTGRVIKMPDRAMTVSYTITVIEEGIERSRTFFTYLPGTVH